MGGQGRGQGQGGKGNRGAEDKVRRRAGWLNSNVFPEKPIDDEAVAAMQGMGSQRAMELFKELEEKAEDIRNPSAYLKGAARREGYGPAEERWSQGRSPGASTDPGKVRKRVNWLNANVFQENPIDDETLAAMQEIDVSKAMEIFKEAEGKAESIKNPSGYLITASSRERGRERERGRGPGAGARKMAVMALPAPGGSGRGRGEHERIERRAAWLSRSLFPSSPIDAEALAAMKGMGLQLASELFAELEERKGAVRNPSAYLKRAAMRAGFGPPAASAASPSAAAGPGSAKAVQRVRKRASWLNEHTFVDKPIDDEAVEAMLEVDVARAMEIFKELEAKAEEVKNPSAYLISSVKPPKGRGGAKRKSQGESGAKKQDSQAPTKRAKVEEST